MMLGHELFLYLKTNWLKVTIITLSSFIILTTLLCQYKSIWRFIVSIFILFKIFIEVISKPIQLLLEIFKFKLKKDYLSIKLALTLKVKNGFLLSNILLNLFLIFLLFLTLLVAYNIQNDDYKSTLYMLGGAVVSIWITHITSIILSINNLIENLETSYTVIADMRQLLTTHYEQLIPFFPYHDDLFKKDGDILYITPVHAGLDNNYLNEELTKTFLTYMEQLNLQILYNSFIPKSTNNLIQCLLKQQFNRQMLQNTVINLKEYISNNLISLFQQVLTCINKMLSLNAQYPNWDTDKQLASQMSMLCYVYIIKLTNCIIFVQREFNIYNEYITHVSHPPRLPISNKLDDVIKLNQEIKKKAKHKTD